jgi:hypothetical protein
MEGYGFVQIITESGSGRLKTYNTGAGSDVDVVVYRYQPDVVGICVND